jgi:hypothetical protein
MTGGGNMRTSFPARNDYFAFLTGSGRAVDKVAGPRLSEPQHRGTETRSACKRTPLLIARAEARRAAVRSLPFKSPMGRSLTVAALLLTANARRAQSRDREGAAHVGGKPIPIGGER